MTSVETLVVYVEVKGQTDVTRFQGVEVGLRNVRLRVDLEIREERQRGLGQ